MKKILFLITLFIFSYQGSDALTLIEHFKIDGYIEICDKKHGSESFDSLYSSFDEFIHFLQKNHSWAQKLYNAKERFIRSKEKSFYSTDFFGVYDESKTYGRSQISFYYCIHFHDFICKYYPEFKQIPEIINFLEACIRIQEPYTKIFQEATNELGLEKIFLEYTSPPILFKVIKYFPSYFASKPHYDGTLLTLFLDSTDNQALLLSPYKASFTINDFFSPSRKFCRNHKQNTILLIPGVFLSEFSINPTPHIVQTFGKIRYASIAFGMRPHYTPKKIEFSSLPTFID